MVELCAIAGFVEVVVGGSLHTYFFYFLGLSIKLLIDGSLHTVTSAHV